MFKSTVAALSVVALAALGVMAGTHVARSQASNALVIGIYAPTVSFADSAARLQYVRRLAKAVEATTGRTVEGKAFATLSALKKAKVDFAIVDAQCYAATRGWTLLANGTIGGRASRGWALYSRLSGGMPALQGKKLAYVKMGCRDKDFVFNAMLDSEVSEKHFGGLVGKPSLTGAVAEVASFKGAEAVFAPVGEAKGLNKVFDTAPVPGPAFVQVNGRLDKDVVNRVRNAVVSYGGGGAISGFVAANDKPFDALRRSLSRRIKRFVFATPPFVRLDASDVIETPKSIDEPGFTEVKQHFAEPPVRQ